MLAGFPAGFSRLAFFTRHLLDADSLFRLDYWMPFISESLTIGLLGYLLSSADRLTGEISSLEFDYFNTDDARLIDLIARQMLISTFHQHTIGFWISIAPADVIYSGLLNG